MVNKWIRAGSVAVGLLALTTFALPAQAVLLIDAGPASFSAPFTGGNYVAGTEFTTTASYTIRSLGYIDLESDGLVGNHTVGLWDVGTEDLLAMAEVTPASATLPSAFVQAQWFMENITPIVIGPGTYRVAGIVGSEADAASDDQIGNGVTLTSGYVRTEFPSGGFAYPNLPFSSQAIRATLAGDVVDPINPVPEPSVGALLALGLGAAGVMTWQRSAKRGA